MERANIGFNSYSRSGPSGPPFPDGPALSGAGLFLLAKKNMPTRTTAAHMPPISSQFMEGVGSGSPVETGAVDGDCGSGEAAAGSET